MHTPFVRPGVADGPLWWGGGTSAEGSFPTCAVLGTALRRAVGRREPA
jgi:hypothetical protein